MRTILMAVAVAVALAAGAGASPGWAAASDALSFYRFTGVCADCDGTGVGTLTLRDYDPVAEPELAQANFVEFTYSSNLLPEVDITSASDLSGSLAGETGPKFVRFQSDEDGGFAFESRLDGFWQLGFEQVVDDFGLDHQWAAATGPMPAVPEPAGWAMMVAGFALAGATLRARPRAAVRFA